MISRGALSVTSFIVSGWYVLGGALNWDCFRKWGSGLLEWSEILVMSNNSWLLSLRSSVQCLSSLYLSIFLYLLIIYRCLSLQIFVTVFTAAVNRCSLNCILTKTHNSISVNKGPERMSCSYVICLLWHTLYANNGKYFDTELYFHMNYLVYLRWFKM